MSPIRASTRRRNRDPAVDADPALPGFRSPPASSRQGEWLPDDADRAFVASLMRPVTGPGPIANGIAPPRRSVDGRPLDYDCVRPA